MSAEEAWVAGAKRARERRAVQEANEAAVLFGVPPDIGFVSETYVYFVWAPCCDAIKIGVAQDVKRRLAGLSTASPHKLKLLAKVRGDEEDEHRLHRELQAFRMRGEWFRATKEVKDVMAREVVAAKLRKKAARSKPQ